MELTILYIILLDGRMEFNASRVDVGFRHTNRMVKRLLDI